VTTRKPQVGDRLLSEQEYQDALAAERRATVERIRERMAADLVMGTVDEYWQPILDLVAS
jgi:hypothetical protein